MAENGFSHHLMINRAQGSQVTALIAAEHATPKWPLDDLFIRAAALQSAGRRSRWVARYQADGARLAGRWKGTTLGELTVGELDAWYVELHGAGGLSGQRIYELNTIVWVALQLARVEESTDSEVTGWGRALNQIWVINGANMAVAGTAGGVGVAVGGALMERSGRKGEPHSGAMQMPSVGFVNLWIDERELLATTTLDAKGDHLPRVVWRIPRTEVAGAHVARRFQMLTRISLRFTDGSRASFMTQKAAAASVAEALGRI